MEGLQKDDAIRRLKFELEKQSKLEKIDAMNKVNQAIQLNQGNSGNGKGSGGGGGGLDQKQLMDFMSQQIQNKEIENVRLKIVGDYEQRIRDMERGHNDRMHTLVNETKKTSDSTIKSLKAMNKDEIKQLKERNEDMLAKLNKLKRELIKKEGDIRVLQQRIKELEREKVNNFEHSELMCKLTSALKGYTQTLEFETYVNKKYKRDKSRQPDKDF
mmetsp:Transcript_6465/g.4587  ORF Transcript_6465/g.4587 Transcript_6465/m.4587 type:complete len:215 (+) Transcript_6465:985-1629(+)|eukprot:CAMPEP_0116875662 /NCGR_PEP_ID=MMETSP0463-20121206/7705_1 /TAXON_ID=181622 /ORGANISM="Strombidinopsis sp, Strain SopsisLIS2011" /LENGTH=214 /DNA_ID=CAMNT_0004521693 /DNA_START=1836 /DNA_END=2480 /DNA_ORIENTATION=-